MRKLKININIFGYNIFLLLFLFIFSNCAKIVAPIGGPKDITPPKTVKQTPANRTQNFNSKTIKILFNEYIVLNNPVDNVLFSPPISSIPEYVVRGKTLVIKFSDTLAANTTYNIGFSDCIKDYTEGNILPYFQYTFSTGNAIDSFFISGEIIDAQSLQPVQDCLILLYKDNGDSLPFHTRPDYITRPNHDGKFLLKYLKPNDYKIFALKDKNQNYLYDLPDESIAFNSKTIKALPIIYKDSNQNDDFLIDSVENAVKLVLFTEFNSTQNLPKLSSVEKECYKIIFTLPIENLSLHFLDTNNIQFLQNMNDTRDTLFLFFKNEIIDTLLLELQSDMRMDTLALLPYEATHTKVRGGKQKETNSVKIEVKHADKPFESLLLLFNQPVIIQDTIPIYIISKKKSGNDTILVYPSKTDDWVMRMTVKFPKEEKVPYQLIIRDSTFFSYKNSTNDSLIYNFTVKSEKDYGDLVMHYEVAKSETPYIVLLLATNDIIVQTDIISASETIIYENLIPGQYKIKVIEDHNANGRWDTGNYLEQTQPEKIFFFPKTISIRGYWEVEERFTFPQEE